MRDAAVRDSSTQGLCWTHGVKVKLGGRSVVSQIEIFALGGERTSGYWSHWQCDAQNRVRPHRATSA